MSTAFPCNGDTGRRRDLGHGAWIRYTAAFVVPHAVVLARLLDELALAPATIRMFGRDVAVPRLVAFHGEPGRRYRYSGRDHDALPWTPTLRALVDRLRATTGTPYDTVLCNHYRDGNDAMGRHSDDEPELGPAPDDLRIASVSLGARRTFRMRRKDDSCRFDLELGEGDLLVMGGTTQRHWRHEVPRTRRPVGQRLNLTFRCARRRDDTACEWNSREAATPRTARRAGAMDEEPASHPTRSDGATDWSRSPHEDHRPCRPSTRSTRLALSLATPAVASSAIDLPVTDSQLRVCW